MVHSSNYFLRENLRQTRDILSAPTSTVKMRTLFQLSSMSSFIISFKSCLNTVYSAFEKNYLNSPSLNITLYKMRIIIKIYPIRHRENYFETMHIRQ